MNRLIAMLQLLFSAVLLIIAVAALINMAFIATRPETISVVNTLIAALLLIPCLLALARILFRKGMGNLKNPEQQAGGSEQNSSH